jgi:DNA-directed RNA polymerase subunit RPC12/RpoP
VITVNSQLLIDGNSIGSEINAYSAGGGVQSARIENLNLSAGAHILTVQGTGSGRVGFSYFNFTAPYESQGGEQPPVTGETLTAAQKKAVEALRSYTMQALKTCTKLQKNPLRLTMANGMMSIDAAQPEQVTEALNAAKAQIDAVLATVYEEELEVNLIDDLFFEGGDMPGWVTSCTSANPPCGQGLDPNIWSRGSHLFWVADKVGDTMELKLSVPYAMEYEAALCYTVAGDYCQYDLYLDGSKLLSIDGYAPAPGVRNVSLGKLILTKGDHVLKAVITGRNAAASGTYALGIDHILLKGDFSLLQVQKAATDYLAAYKQQKDYSAAQWQQCLACVQEFTDKINAAHSEADIRALWKNGKAALDAIATGILDFDTVEFDAGKTPGSFGWNAENNDFSAWKTDSDGQVYYVAYEGMHSKRIWKNLITDPDNFTLTLRAKVRTLRASIELMGVVVELNAEHGNGSQLFDKESWSWYYADDQICTVTLTRVNGGDLFVKLLGKGSSTAVSYTKSISNSADTNLYLGAIDNGGSAYFTEIAITGLEAQSVEDFGWDTDMVNGSKDFSGWTTFDGVNIAADYSKTVNNHCIWKNLLTDQNDFTATLDVTADNKSSAYVKLLGVTLELDGNGGDGNQVFVKLNGSNQDWLTCTGCVTNVKITRKAGGDLTFTLTGLGNDTPMTFTVTPTEQNENLELGLYRGMAKFRNICTSPVQTCEHNWILDANASVAATCTAAGTNVYTCSKCGASRSETIAALGHAWDAGKVTTEPTATEKGVRTYTCTRCGVTMTEEIPATGEIRLPFTDVPEGKWYTEAVKFVYVNKLFSGTSATTFSPNNSMTRGMLVAVLWRLDGSPAPNGSNSFTDVKSGKYYENAVTWAAENKLVSGIGNGKFNPDGKVNREQIAVIIFRYAGFKGYSTEKTADLSKYPRLRQSLRLGKSSAVLGQTPKV